MSGLRDANLIDTGARRWSRASPRGRRCGGLELGLLLPVEKERFGQSHGRRTLGAAQARFQVLNSTRAEARPLG